MHRFDPDLIAALAAGTLDPTEAAELERDIAADPVASEALAAQRAALDFLRTADTPQLSAAERSKIESAVAAALGLDAPDAVAHQAPRRIPWGPLGIAAAALAGLIAVVPVVGLLSTGGSDAGGSLELAAEAPEATDAEPVTALADSAAETARTDEFAAGDDADSSAFGSSTTLQTNVAPGSESAPIESTTTTNGSTTTGLSSTTSTAAAATTSTAASPELDQLVAELSAIQDDPDTLSAMSRSADQNTTCWVRESEDRGDPPPNLSVFEYDNGEYTVIVYYVVTGGNPGPLRVRDLSSCDEVIVVDD